MSNLNAILNTKPRWCPTAVAGDNGWVNATTGELLVSFRGLKRQIESLQIVESSNITMNAETLDQLVPTVEQKVIPVKETKIKKPKKNQRLIAEVVEFDVNETIIGE